MIASVQTNPTASQERSSSASWQLGVFGLFEQGMDSLASALDGRSLPSTNLDPLSREPFAPSVSSELAPLRFPGFRAAIV